MKKIIYSFLALIIVSIGYSQNKVSFTAEITNKNGDIVYIKDTKNVTVKEIKSNDKGVFNADLDVLDGFYIFFDGKEYAQLFLKNGYNLNMTLDAANFDETIKFSGKGAEENNFLAQATVLNSKYDYDTLLAANPENFKKLLDEKKSSETVLIEKSGLDVKFIELQKQSLEMGMKGLEQYYNQTQQNKKLNNTVAPNFDYLNHAGGKTSLESLKGKYVYIDVWATWCGPCVAEIPFLKKVEEKYHGKNIEFVSISVDQEKDFEKWKSVVTNKQLGGIQLFADKNWTSDFIKAFAINSIPRFILIDPAGKVVNADSERPSNPELQVKLDQLLK